MHLDAVIGYLKRIREEWHIDPERDWYMLASLSVIAVAGIIVWNVATFDTVANGGVIGAPPAQTIPLFNPASLDTIKTIFDNRAAEEQKYRDGTYRFADPSQ